LVPGGLCGWGGIGDRCFTGVTLELVQHELPLRLRAALGVELCHRVQERVELKWTPAARRSGFSGSRGVVDVRREAPDALIRRGDFKTIGFARGSWVRCNGAADRAEAQQRREVSAL